MLPASTSDGLLPVALDGEPYSAYPDEIGMRFGAGGDRERSWRGFCSLRELVDEVVSESQVPLVTWWLRGKFITDAADVTEVDAVALLPPAAQVGLRSSAQSLLGLLTSPDATRQVFHCVVEVEMMYDEHLFEKTRRRCSRNRVDDAGELSDAGWVVVL